VADRFRFVAFQVRHNLDARHAEILPWLERWLESDVDSARTAAVPAEH
jgi:hypothetical protein